MILLMNTTNSTDKRSHCVCERDLFPDNCDCGFDFEEKLRRAKQIWLERERMIFLSEYPWIVFPPYKTYNQGSLLFFLGPSPTRSERNKIILEELKEFRSTLQRPTIYSWVDEDKWRITDICVDLIHEYNWMGYKEFKKDWDSDRYYGEGKLLRNPNLKVGDIVGEVIEYVSPSLQIEGIIDPFVKAIAIVETFQSKDGFIDAWNEFFQGSHELSDSRFVYFGYVQDRYIGWNNPFDREKNSASQSFVQLTNRKLGQFWDRAVMTVKALLVIDCLKAWAHVHFTSHGLYNESFDFDF
jgi:hypothetical protein